ncbi:MAG: S8 family peptidase [Zoogloeaceae bacterium]|nr:S8 family peptidase [Zoogloeaceae bacterium]
MSYEHLKFDRESPLTERHRRRGFPSLPPPEDPRTFGEGLRQSFGTIRQPAPDELPGFDDRILFKVQLREGATLPDLDQIPGVELVSHEDKTIVLAFASRRGLEEFESRLSSLASNGMATRKDLLFALQDFDHWKAEDRKGAALKQQDFPSTDTFILDVELWPLERTDQRNDLLMKFLVVLQEKGIEKLDTLNLPSLVMVRVRCTQIQAETVLLKHRDIRMVDLPPQFGVSVEMLRIDINQVFVPPSPPETAPAIAVLDAGLTTGHPLLKAAVGDAQGYLAPNRQPHDNSPWHGTFVSGLALYGDVQERLRQREFVPRLRLFSGKVFEDNGLDQTEFVEKAVEEAVKDLHEQYGCRVFNLSYGDLHKIYDGRHVRGLAYTLDRLTRDLDVLFVVPTGNLCLDELPQDLRNSYPGYLFEDNARLLDPAPALNVLTVGGLARNTATRDAQAHPHTIENFPVAQEEQPFPLTRSGLSIGGAIKPDLVEYAGNLAVGRMGGTHHQGLGIISTNGGFISGHLFAERIGTSYAAPQVAHRAARLLNEIPDASANLLRALLVAHARWPQDSVRLLNNDDSAEGKHRCLQLLGYGRIDDKALYRSVEQAVTLFSEDRIVNNKCHFYELPVPDSFWATSRRRREITVALAYSPDIRTTRLDYRMSKLWFSLVRAESLDKVEDAFKKNREEGISELSHGRWLTSTARNKGTMQTSRWTFQSSRRNQKKLFVVVTRQDVNWGTVDGDEEPYSLVVVIDDKENTQTNLYAEIRTRLEARFQARSRARV